MAETPLEQYLRLRKLPNEEVCEFTFNPTFADNGDIYTLAGVVMRWPKKTGEQEYTGSIILGHEQTWYKPNNFLDSIRSAHFTDGRFEVDAQAYRQEGRIVEVENGKPKIFDLHLSIGIDGVIVTGALETGLLRWQGDGLVYIENEQGRKVEMQHTETPTE